MTSSKKSAPTPTGEVQDDVLKLIANSTDGNTLIDLREQAERLQSRPDLTAKAIALALPIEEQRNQRRSEAALKNEDVNLEGLAIPALPIPLKALYKDKLGAAYLGMKAGLDESTVLYAIKKKEGADVAQAFTLRVMAGEVNGEAVPVVVTPDDQIVEDGEFIAYQLGNGAHAYVRFGPIIVKTPIAPSDAFIKERRDRNADQSAFDYGVVAGVPPLTMKSALMPGLEIDSMKSAPMAFIHPRFEDKVPWRKPLTILSILGMKTRFDGVRVVAQDEDGNLFPGVLAVDGIRRVCGERQETAKGGTMNVLTEASIGRRFQIEGATLRTNKKGKPINVEGQTETEFLKDNPGESFIECWDVQISDPDDQFVIEV